MDRKRGLLLTALLLVQLLAGCTSVLDNTVEPRATLIATPSDIQQGEEVTFDARDSDAIEGVITEFAWDFGDGTEITTLAGFTSHQFVKAGQFNVKLTVTNDQGGSDSTSVLVRVNGAPVLNLSVPEVVRSGDIVLLDASRTADPEGAPMDFKWDLNFLEDSDGDGDARNDIDSKEETVYLPTESSGTIIGSVTVDDRQGGVATEQFTIEVQTRRYKVSWVQNTLEWNYDDYLDQGESWSDNMTPGDGVRIMAYDALLELDQDLILPPDDFTLSLNIVDDGYRKSAETSPGNITRNETTTAELNASGLNPSGEEGILEADSEEELLRGLLNEPGARFGQGEWIWTIVAQNANPDSQFPGQPDPDTGNDWKLTIVITILTPVLTEVAYE
ncbi:MAG: PKD domain-containing protein [Euryarchaeota archaeon]|jgi:PKD repeat protein|nr:PKD domain-containing protein [Euryarchaeota archaeon]MBT7244856.1 PKD domain-containing protein [Euryarchaeota archaeon]